MEMETPNERTTLLRAAIKECFAAREPVTPANVRAKLPADFFTDFDTGEPLDDATVFAEIQSTYVAQSVEPHRPTPAPMIETNPEGHKLAPAPVESFPDYLPPSEKIAEPVEVVSTDTTPAPVAEIAAPVVEDETAKHELGGPGPTPQARLDGARAKEGNLLAERPSLINAQRAARAAVALAVQEYQRSDPNRQTPEQLSAEYRATSQATRAARAQAPGPIAYVDLERKYSQGGDGNAFARRMNRTGNRHGAYSRQSLGQVNRDETRGPVPAPVTTPRPTIPALGK